MSRKRSALLLAASGVLLVSLPASAHVTVHSTDATKGADDAEIVFRVPNEESSPTTKVEIALPADTPIAGVYAQSKPGWTFAVKTQKLATPIKTDDGDISTAVIDVTWTATAGGIPEGGYDDFTLAAGLLPDVDSITFKAVQTYKDGDVVRWIETGDEAEHPAPVLSLTGEDASHHGTEASASPTVSATASAPAAAPVTAKSDDSTGKALGGAGLGVGVVALLVALGALVRGRRA